MKRLLAGVAAMLALGAPAMAATSFEPGVDWRTIETPHFRINYPRELETLGRKVAAFAEDAHGKVAPFMGVKPYEKTEIVCFNTYDDTNANASNYPHNRILLNLRAPSPDGGLPIGRYDDWIRYVLLHEYTHILHLNETPWALVELNAILGKVLFSFVPMPGIPRYVSDYVPSMLSDCPRFITEGWAVTTESRFTPGGRAHEGDFDRDLRMATLERRLYTIDQVNGSYLLDWPSGGNEYDYGMAFFQYVDQTYGDDKPAKILGVLGKMPWLGIDFAVSQVLPGKSCNSLWDETMGWLHQRYATQVAEIRKNPLTEAVRLTTSGRSHHHPHWLPDGSLAVTESYKGKTSTLIRFDPGKTSPTVLCAKDALSDYAFEPGGSSLVNAVQGDERFTSYFDLYRTDLARHQATRLTTHLRASDPAVSPDGKQIAAVVSAEGTNYLVLLDAQGKVVRHLCEPTADFNFANPAWSPDGKSLVVSRWSIGHYHLVLMDVATGTQVELTHGSALDFYPSFTPDGQYVVFSSDRSGVTNLYALRLADRQLWRVTNVLGGAQEGAVSPDGKHLAFINYSSLGYDLRVMPFDPTRFLSAKMDESLMSDFDGHFAPRQVAQATPVDMSYALAATPHPYQPLASMLPNTYAPLITADDKGMALGLSMFGQDVLRQQTYQVLGGLGVSSARPFYGFYYQNDQLLPSLSLMYFRAPGTNFYPVSTGAGVTFATLWQDQQSFDLSARVPGVPLPLLGSDWVTGDSWVFGFKGIQATNYGLGLSNGTDSIVLPVAAGSLPPSELSTSEGLTDAAYVLYQRADNYTRSYGIAPEGGSLATLGYEKSAPFMGGLGNYDRVWGEYRRYVALPFGRQSLALRALTGMSWGQNGSPFIAGGNAAQFTTQMDLTALESGSSLSTSRIPLRGYDFAGLGDKIAVLSAEYRMPLLEVNKGLWTLPFYLDRVYAVAGGEVGNLWDSPFLSVRSFQLQDTLAGVSLELRAQMHLFRYLKTDLRIGVAQGLRTPSWASTAYPVAATLQPILGLGTTF